MDPALEKGGAMKSAHWDRWGGLDVRIRPSGILLALGYAFVCWNARKLSLDQFYLPAGVRVASLLIFPPRLWLYLLVGEYAYFALLRYPLIETYGATWVMMGSVFLMPAVASIVHLHKRQMRRRSDAWLLSVAASSALSVSFLNLAISHALWPVPPADSSFLVGIFRYAVGDFAGILTLAPLALLWVRRREEPSWSHEMLLAVAVTLLVMLLLGASAAALPDSVAGARATLQLLMLIPAIAMTIKYAWRGAAISVPALSLIIGCTTPAENHLSFHGETFEIQLIAAVAGSALLILGSIITHDCQQHRSSALAKMTAIKQFRMSQLAGEMDLRDRALRMRNLGEGLDQTLSQIAQVLDESGNPGLAKSLWRISVLNSRHFRSETSMVYPTSLEHVGLYLALQIGGINEAWNQTNRMSSPRLVGDPCQLSMGLQLAAYRTMVEAASLLLKHEAGQIQIRARCGRMGGYRGIVASVGLIDSEARLSESTMRLAIERLTGRTLAYGGTVQCRRNRVRILLVEASAGSVGKAGVQAAA